MGSRVDYVVVRDGGHTVYAQGGGAGYGIAYNVAPGPDVELLHGLRERWAELWPGWTLEFWGDDLTRQAIHDPDRLHGVTSPRAVTHYRHELAERVQAHRPVRSTMVAKGVDVDWMHRENFAGLRGQLDANVTAEEMERVVELLRGPRTAEDR